MFPLLSKIKIEENIYIPIVKSDEAKKVYILVVKSEKPKKRRNPDVKSDKRQRNYINSLNQI